MVARPIIKALLASTALVLAWCVLKPAMAQGVHPASALPSASALSLASALPPTSALPSTTLPAPSSATAACDTAGEAAEARYDLPPGLLRAIGRVESGRRDPATGQVAPWPWAINAEGRGQLFFSRDEALAATRTLQSAGVASVDVGCFQVNLVHHPLAFPTLEDGFDPAHNADYAARFLLSLRAKTGNWDAAVAAYHSATPELGLPYRDRVLAVWGHQAPNDGPQATTAASPASIPLVVRVITWSPPKPGASPSGMRIWTPSAAGQGAAVIRITRG
jgi:hypothetical protein